MKAEIEQIPVTNRGIAVTSETPEERQYLEDLWTRAPAALVFTRNDDTSVTLTVGPSAEEATESRGASSMRRFGNRIFLDKAEVSDLCRPGAEADTCIWLVVGGDGFECQYFDRSSGRNLEGETLEDRWKAGKTVAKRDGCSKVIEQYTVEVYCGGGH